MLLRTPLRPLARQPPPTLLINFGGPSSTRAQPPPLATVPLAARVVDGGESFDLWAVLWVFSGVGCVGTLNRGRLSFSLPSQLSSLSCLGPAAGSRGPVRF